MQADSRPVSSNQQHVHPKLPLLVNRSLSSIYRKPISTYSRNSFEQLEQRLAEKPSPLVIDSFCGTGHSAAFFAKRHPDHLVVGVDKSPHRLAKHPGSPNENYILLRAECEDIWRLMLERDLTADFHYLLYPNPWPKSGHLQRRIHGHPTFKTLLELGGQIELRSNWKLYVEEFGIAMNLGGVVGKLAQIMPTEPITLFEKKYQSSGHPLWAFTAKVKKSEQSSVTAQR